MARKVTNVERLDDGQVRITDDQGDQHEGPMGELPNELTAQVAEGFMRQKDYTKKTQEMSELRDEMEEMREQLAGLQGGPGGQQAGGNTPQQGSPNAPGGFNAGAASPQGGGTGQSQGTTAEQNTSSPSSFQFESITGNQVGQSEGNQNMPAWAQQIIRNQRQLTQEMQTRRAKEAEEKRIGALSDKYNDPSFESNASAAFQQLPRDERKDLQNLPKSRALELAYLQNQKSNGSERTDANRQEQQASRQGQQQTPSQKEPARRDSTPYTEGGDTAGPSGSPRQNQVARTDAEIAEAADKLGNHSETEARNRVQP